MQQMNGDDPIKCPIWATLPPCRGRVGQPPTGIGADLKGSLEFLPILPFMGHHQEECVLHYPRQLAVDNADRLVGGSSGTVARAFGTRVFVGSKVGHRSYYLIPVHFSLGMLAD